MHLLTKYSSWLINLAIVGFIFVIYYPTKGAGLTFDTIDWFYDYSTHPNFDYFKPAFDGNVRPIYHFILYKYYLWAGISAKKWYLLFCGLFSIMILSYQLFLRSFFEKFDFKNGKSIAIISSILIAFSPFCTEIVVWYATIHYHLVFTTTFLILFLISSLDTKFKLKSFLILALFVFSIFCIELAYCIIPIAFLYFYILNKFEKTKLTWKQFGIYVFIPLLVIFVAYNIFIYLSCDKFLGHYKIAKYRHPLIFTFSHYLAMCVKAIFLPNFFGENTYKAVFKFIFDYEYFLFVGIFAPITFWIYKIRKSIFQLNLTTHIILFFILSSFLFYIPISFLFFHTWKEIELDRLMVGTILFLAPLVVFLAYHFELKLLKYTILPIYFLMGLYLLVDYNYRWQAAYEIKQNYISKMPTNEGKTIILASPVLYKYCYVNAINDSLELPKTLKIFRDIPFQSSKYYIPAYYNMNLLDDVITTTKINDSTLRCDIRNWGIWYWRTLALGLVKYENYLYKVEPINDVSYQIIFKKLDGTEKFYLFNQLSFHEVNWQKAANGTIFI